MRKIERDFKRLANYLKSPYRIDKADLINFLCDIKKTGKVDNLINLKQEEIMRLSKSELIIEFDIIRARLHARVDIFKTLFPNLKLSYLDKLTYGEKDFDK